MITWIIFFLQIKYQNYILHFNKWWPFKKNKPYLVQWPDKKHMSFTDQCPIPSYKTTIYHLSTERSLNSCTLKCHLVSWHNCVLSQKTTCICTMVSHTSQPWAIVCNNSVIQWYLSQFFEFVVYLSIIFRWEHYLAYKGGIY